VPASVNKGDILTLKYGSKNGVRGELVKIPISIVNNSAYNKGVGGFIIDQRYNPNYLEFVSFELDAWVGTIKNIRDLTQSELNEYLAYNSLHNYCIVDDTNVNNGVIRVYGKKLKAEQLDLRIGYITYRVRSDVPDSVGTIYIDNPSIQGTGSGSELLTIQNEHYYYFIKPIVHPSCEISLTSSVKPPSYSYVGGGGGYIGGAGGGGGSGGGGSLGGSASIGGGIFIGGTGSGGGTGRVDIYVGGVLVGSGTFPFIKGDTMLDLDIPIEIPPGVSGDVSYDIVLEPDDPDDELYIFIPAFSIKIDITVDVPIEEAGTIIIKPVAVKGTDIITIKDGFRVFEKLIPTGDVGRYGETIVIIDGVRFKTFRFSTLKLGELISIADSVVIHTDDNGDTDIEIDVNGEVIIVRVPDYVEINDVESLKAHKFSKTYVSDLMVVVDGVLSTQNTQSYVITDDNVSMGDGFRIKFL
jgi:hypothetical protein